MYIYLYYIYIYVYMYRYVRGCIRPQLTICMDFPRKQNRFNHFGNDRLAGSVTWLTGWQGSWLAGQLAGWLAGWQKLNI